MEEAEAEANGCNDHSDNQAKQDTKNCDDNRDGRGDSSNKSYASIARQQHAALPIPHSPPTPPQLSNFNSAKAS